MCYSGTNKILHEAWEQSQASFYTVSGIGNTGGWDRGFEKRGGEGNMSKLKSTAHKIQTALSMKGRHITINQTQTYSDRLGKMCTKYILRERRDILGRKRNITLLETFRMAEVVTFLAEELSGGE